MSNDDERRFLPYEHAPVTRPPKPDPDAWMDELPPEQLAAALMRAAALRKGEIR